MTAVTTGQARRAITHLCTDQNFISVCSLLDEVKRSLRRKGNARELYVGSSSSSFVQRWFHEVRDGSREGRSMVAGALGAAWIDLAVHEDECGTLRLADGTPVPRGLFYDTYGLHEVWPGDGDEPATYDVLESG